MRGNGFGNGNRVKTPKTLQCRPVAYSNRASPTARRRRKVVERNPSFPVSYGRDTKDWNAVQNQQIGQNFNNQSTSRPLSSAGTFSSTRETPSATTLFSSSSLRTTKKTMVRKSTQSALPKDWQEFVDQTSGKSYFYNRL